MSNWSDTSHILGWIQNWYIDLKTCDDAETLEKLLLKMQSEFMSLYPKEKATAFMWLIGKVIRDGS